jgi:hypothetical protein
MQTSERRLKGEELKKRAVETLKKHGYEPYGSTESFKIITAKSYPLPGKIVSGRLRMWIPNTSQRVTVGPRTVCFYQVIDKKAQGWTSRKTTELAEIRDYARFYWSKAEAERRRNGRKER